MALWHALRFWPGRGADSRPRRAWSVGRSLPVRPSAVAGDAEVRGELARVRELVRDHGPEPVARYLQKIERLARPRITVRTRAEILLRLARLLLEAPQSSESVLSSCRQGLRDVLASAGGAEADDRAFWMIVRGAARRLDSTGRAAKLGTPRERSPAAVRGDALGSLMAANEALAAALYTPDGAAGIVDAGSLYLGCEQLKLAASCVERVRARSPGRTAAEVLPKLEFLDGRCRFAANDTAGASVAFQEAIRLGYPAVAVTEWQVCCYLVMGNTSDALRVVEAALAESDESSSCWHLRLLGADVHLARGDDELALAAYLEIVNGAEGEDPHFARFGLGLERLKASDLEAAKQWFDQVPESVNKGILRSYGSGLLMAARNQFQDATIHLEAVTKAWPWAGAAQVRLCECYLATQRFKDGARIFDRALKVVSDSSLLKLKFLQAALREGEFDRAAQHLPSPAKVAAMSADERLQWCTLARAARDELIAKKEIESALVYHELVQDADPAGADNDRIEAFLRYESVRKELQGGGPVSKKAAEDLRRAGLLAPGSLLAGELVGLLAEGLRTKADAHFAAHHADLPADFRAAFEDLRSPSIPLTDPRLLPPAKALATYLSLCGEFAAIAGGGAGPNVMDFVGLLESSPLAEAATDQHEWLEYHLARTVLGIKQNRAQSSLARALAGLKPADGHWQRLHVILGIREASRNDDVVKLRELIGKLRTLAEKDPIAKDLDEPVTRNLVALHLRQTTRDAESRILAALRVLADELYPQEVESMLQRRDHEAARLAEALGKDDLAREIRTAMADHGDPLALHWLATRAFAEAQAAAALDEQDLCLDHFRAGVVRWRALMETEPFWHELSARLGRARYNGGRIYAPSVLSEVRDQWPLVLRKMILHVADEAGRGWSNTKALRQLAEEIGLERGAMGAIKSQIISAIIDPDFPFLANAFSILDLTPRTENMVPIQDSAGDLVAAAETTPGIPPLSRHGVSVAINAGKVTRAAEALLTLEGRAVNELLMAAPEPSPWLGYPEQATQRFDKSVLIVQLQEVLAGIPDFDEARLLGRLLPTANNLAPRRPGPAAPITVGGAVPVPVHHQLPLSGGH